MPAIGLPTTFATDVDLPVLDGELHVHQANDLEGERQVLGLLLQPHQHRRIQRMGGERAGAVAGMDASFLDVLHDPGDEHVFAVTQRIDIDFDGVSQEAVNQQRTLRRHHQF
jgi:hypothetical protein